MWTYVEQYGQVIRASDSGQGSCEQKKIRLAAGGMAVTAVLAAPDGDHGAELRVAAAYLALSLAAEDCG